MSNTLDHFDIPTNIKDRNTNFKAKCKHCFSVISGSLKMTSNFATHLKVRVSITTIICNSALTKID
jgi:hypothetical protein